MDTFSQRHGFKPKRDIMQIESMNDDLRNSLWNVLVLLFWSQLERYYQGYHIDYREKESSTYKYVERDDIKSLVINLWFSHFKQQFDNLSWYWRQDYTFIKQSFFEYKWYEIYDFLEFIARNYRNDSTLEQFIGLCNDVLERELSGYRFLDLIITPITSETEINIIEEALAGEDRLAPVSNHINTALTYLSRKENPDYRNSIKESISAVESICCLIANDKKATLGKALNMIEKEQKLDLHPALSKAFSQLYGYTSDADGIRHALLDESDLDFEDAKFMLVSCSAFTNYLKGKIIKAGIDFNNQQQE
ncbi:AbiJ-NTD4 domain-containing protein [Nostoc sp.]|uniref:AbiJ-NTD4 domain-containing protein n=1 Tax=Nostoc sp. TaxID=1180 RepID=UPI002FF48D67